MYLVILSVVFSLHTSCVCSELNLTRLMSIYINSCGEDGVCKDWPGLTNYQRNPIQTRCPPCSCEDTCFRDKTCCPDKFFERKITRFRYPLSQMQMLIEKSVSFTRYPVIDSCPPSAEKSYKSLCIRPSDGIEERIFVTSLVSNYTYYNIFCALCNGENKSNTVEWDIYIDGYFHFMYFIESRNEMFTFLKRFDNSVMFTPPERLHSIISTAHAEKKTYSEISCPDDEDLQIACSSSYVNEFRLFKNVFCLLCKLKRLKRSHHLINSCQTSVTDTIHKFCEVNPTSELTYPYRNFYCFLCNIPNYIYHDSGHSYSDGNNKKYSFLDFSSNVYEDFLGIRNRVTFHDIVFYDEIILNKIWKAKTEKTHDSNISKLIQYTPNQLKYLLTKMAAVYPHRICNQQVLPTIIQSNGTRNCNCSLPCLFRDPCSCCMDTALLYPVDCISNTRRAFSKDGKERELKIQVVGICYEEIHRSRNSRERENVKHLCEGELDEFDIPVLSNNITYKNIFCFLCNTNFFIVNGSLLTEPYKIVDIKINCEEQFLFNFLMGFHQMFAYSILNKCDVRYEADFLVTCHDNASEALGTISKCKASDSHFDPFEKWACENTSRQSLMPVGNYKNEFCRLCNPSEITKLPTYLKECKESDTRNVRYKNACLSLPNVQHHPLVHPYKNIFCLYCAKEYNKIPHNSSEKCFPNFIRKSPRTSDLMRHLFAPLMTFKPSTFQLKSKSTEDECFPGRIMEDGICTPIIVYPRMIPYDLHVLCSLKISASTNDTKRILSQIKSSVFEILKNSTFNSDGEIIGFYILPRQPVRTQNRNGFIYSELQVSLHYVLLHTTPFNRIEEENKLLKIPQMLKMNHTTDAPNKISFLINGIRFANLSKTLTSPNIMILINEHASFLKYYKQMLLHLYNPLACNVIVSELLTCRHRFIDKMNYVVDKKHYRIIIKSSNEVFYLGEYIIHFDQKVSVCANVPLKISLETGLSEALGILTTVLNGISILFLFVLFAIYIYIPNLRTLPGMNMLNLTFCLFCMQITYTIANALQKATFYCKVTGILLHYFWLCLCCSMFICSLHMFRSFRNFSSRRHDHGNHSNKIFLRYAIICYTVPFIMVLLNVVLSYYINGSVGYGVRLCFVDHYIQNIVTFIVPLLLTCINNIVMFICTIPNINFSRDIKKSEDNRSELLIFIKLFSLTGGVWILQVIDSILHISFFSFVTTILTSSQGLFIFLSFATSQQILKHLKEIRRGFGRNVGVQRK